MILVVGATGALGGTVTRMLLAQRQAVRILARPQSSFRSLEDAGAQVAQGDLKQRGSLDPACVGVDMIITTATAMARGGPDTVQAVDLEGSRHLIDAARAAGVRRFIFVSALGADPQSPVPLLQAKGATEAYLRQSGLTFTILAPNGYMEVVLQGIVGRPTMAKLPVTIVGGGQRKHAFISSADVAAFILAAVGNPSALNRKLVLGGPQALSLRDAVAIYERVLGHQIPIKSVAPGEPIPGLPPEVTQLLTGLDTYDSPNDMTETAATYGVKLTPLEEVVRRTVTRVGSA